MNSCLLHTDHGRKRFVKRKQIQELLLSGAALEQISPNEYRWHNPVKVFHSFSDMGELREKIGQPVDGKTYLAGTFIFEHKNKRRFERLETPEGMAVRLQLA